MVDFYNFITSAEGKKVTSKGWKTAGIYDAIHLGIGKLPAMDPLVNESNTPIATNLEVVCQLNQDQLDLFHTREDKDEDDVMKKMYGNQKFKLQTHLTFFRIMMTSNLCKIIFLVAFLNIILIDNWITVHFLFFQKKPPICERKKSQIAKAYLAKYLLAFFHHYH